MTGFEVDEETELNKFSDSPEFEELKNTIVDQLFEINGQISTVTQFIGTLENFLVSEDAGAVNAKVVNSIDKRAIQNIEKIKSLVNIINGEVSRIESIENDDLNQLQLIAKDKVLRDIRSSINEFQNLQKKYTSLIKEINERARVSLGNKTVIGEDNILLIEEENDSQRKTQSQEQIQGRNIVIPRESINNEEFAYQQNLIRQRNEEIQNIERGITEINDIFTDLSNVIQDQGMIVDNIEANIYTTLDNTQMASNELNKALRYQKNSSKWCVYLLIILLVMLFLMMLIILI